MNFVVVLLNKFLVPSIDGSQRPCRKHSGNYWHIHWCDRVSSPKSTDVSLALA